MIKEFELGEFDLDSFMNESSECESAATSTGEGSSRQIVFVIDASNSMQGHKIGAVNDCVNNIISKLRSLDRSQENAIRISVIGFSTRLFRWTDSFVRASEFKYSYVEMVDGLTDINAAFNELTMLSNNMEKAAKKYVVLFSDGLFTEGKVSQAAQFLGYNYSESMARWSQAELFPEIERIAVVFDDDLHDTQSLGFFKELVGAGLIVPISDQEQLLSALLK